MSSSSCNLREKNGMPLKERQKVLKISFSDITLLIDCNHFVFQNLSYSGKRELY